MATTPSYIPVVANNDANIYYDSAGFTVIEGIKNSATGAEISVSIHRSHMPHIIAELLACQEEAHADILDRFIRKNATTLQGENQ